MYAVTLRLVPPVPATEAAVPAAGELGQVILASAAARGLDVEHVVVAPPSGLRLVVFVRAPGVAGAERVARTAVALAIAAGGPLSGWRLVPPATTGHQEP